MRGDKPGDKLKANQTKGATGPNLFSKAVVISEFIQVGPAVPV